MGLLEKFGAEQSPERHGDHLTWPGTDAGFPILGKVTGAFKEREYEELEHKLTYHSRDFLLWDPDDHREYLYIMERAVNGWFKVYDRERRWDDEHKGYRVWLEWAQVYGVAPRQQGDAVHDYMVRPGGMTFDAG
jgi:hypothetical protein